MTDTEQEDGHGLRLMMTLLIIALIAAAILVVIDYRLKAQIVAEAQKLREAGYAQQQQQSARGHAPAPRQPVPAPVPRIPVVDAMADGAGIIQDDVPHEAAPIVKPGDESARPPRRGSFNVPGTGDGL